MAIYLIYLGVEYRIDLFSIFTLLGIAQALFLSFFFLNRNSIGIERNRFQGYFLISIAAVILEAFLMYTGYIVNVLHLVDFSEPIALLMGPFLYFMVAASVNMKVKRWPHYIYPSIYFAYWLFLFLQSADMKYNGYLEAYHPDWPVREVNMRFSDDPLDIRQHHSEMVIVSMLLYVVLALRLLLSNTDKVLTKLWRPNNPVIARARDYTLLSFLMVVVVVLSKSLLPRDFGDHYISLFATFVIYFASFHVIKESRLFGYDLAKVKYSKSSLTEEMKKEAVRKIEKVMDVERPFLQLGFNLNEFSKSLGLSTHHVSQVINDEMDLTFNELVGQYRISFACELLASEEGRRLKLEELAERVGYSSKSSFNSNFKKVIGKTPSEYRDQLELP